MRPEWRDFSGGVWEREINVRDFIQKNYTPYDGDDTFLAGPTQATKDLWAHSVTIAGSYAQLTVDMLVSLRNKAMESYNELMRMNI